ncbi:hypothetical protein VTN00DRAFT_4325 [Thermoascus crustaceus]|uniref:uncharacterized protein n=1 Tax=Thermoascus crustaceus TaxID=5088 RepID=UPI0037439146
MVISRHGRFSQDTQGGVERRWTTQQNNTAQRRGQPAGPPEFQIQTFVPLAGVVGDLRRHGTDRCHFRPQNTLLRVTTSRAFCTTRTLFVDSSARVFECHSFDILFFALCRAGGSQPPI